MPWKLGKQKGTELVEAIPLHRFFRYADIFYLSIGMEAYDHESGVTSDAGRPPKLDWFRRLLRLCFIFQMLNLNLVLLTELIYVFLAFSSGNNILEATMNLSFIGFVIIGDLKIRHIWNKRARITQVLQRLQQLHPASVEQQVTYKVDDYLRSCSRISIFYFGVHLVLIWTYNLYWAVYYLIYDFWLGIRKFERMLPYYCWTPWDWKTHWSYYVLYVSHNIGGQACLSGQLAADLFLCALVTLVVMHFQRLSAQIEQHVAGVMSAQEDMAVLQANVIYHQHLLNMCQDINGIFGVSLFFNFASSSFIICFVIFQITVSGQIDNMVMLLLFLFCATLQVFVIGNYAQHLINASELVGQSVYNHDWFKADLRYRKLMLMIMQRAQRPSYLKATSFLDVSLVTMTDLLQLSYKFFALLRTMYAQ